MNKDERRGTNRLYFSSKRTVWRSNIPFAHLCVFISGETGTIYAPLLDVRTQTAMFQWNDIRNTRFPSSNVIKYLYSAFFFMLEDIIEQSNLASPMPRRSFSFIPSRGYIFWCLNGSPWPKVIYVMLRIPRLCFTRKASKVWHHQRCCFYPE